MNTRRRKVVFATAEMLAALFFPSRPGDWHRTDAGLPDGAVLLNCGYEFDTHQFWFVFCHESFPEVPDGAWATQFDDVRFSALHVDPTRGCDAETAKVISALVTEQLRRVMYWKLAADASVTPIFHFDELKLKAVKIPLFDGFTNGLVDCAASDDCPPPAVVKGE